SGATTTSQVVREGIARRAADSLRDGRAGDRQDDAGGCLSLRDQAAGHREAGAASPSPASTPPGCPILTAQPVGWARAVCRALWGRRGVYASAGFLRAAPSGAAKAAGH